MSFQSELAARSSSDSEDSGGEQKGPGTTCDRQNDKSSLQTASSIRTVKPAISLLTAGLTTTHLGVTQADTAMSKSALESADAKKPAEQPATRSIPIDRVRSSKESVTRDRPLLSTDLSSPGQQTASVCSQAKVENIGTPTENAASAGQATDSQLTDAAEIASARGKKAGDAAGDLAVAIQIRTAQPNQESTASPDPGQDQPVKPALASTTIANAHAHELGVAITPATQQREHHAPEAVQASAQVVDSGTRTPNNSANQSSSSSDKPANATEFQAELESAKAEPVRGAHVQIAGDNNAKVDVRLFERNGALSVTVRSGDPTLTRALQDRAPELTARLSSDHFRSETWTPSPENRSEPNSSREGSSQKNDTGAQGEQSFDGRRGNKGHQQQPGWIEELEAHPVPFFRKG